MAGIHSVSLQSKVTPFADAQEQSALVATSAKVDNFASQITQKLTPVNAKLNLVSEALVLHDGQLTDIEAHSHKIIATMIRNNTSETGAGSLSLGANANTIGVLINNSSFSRYNNTTKVIIFPNLAEQDTFTVQVARILPGGVSNSSVPWAYRTFTFTIGGTSYANWKVAWTVGTRANNTAGTATTTGNNVVMPMRIYRLDAY